MGDILILLLLIKNRKRFRDLQETVYQMKQQGLFQNIAFRKYFYGPYSSDLHNCVDTLKACGLVTEKDGILELTKLGEEWLENQNTKASENRVISE